MMMPAANGVMSSTNQKNVAILVLSLLRPEDEGVYKCRADFKRSPTKNNRMFLSILGEYYLTPFSRIPETAEISLSTTFLRLFSGKFSL
jgi:hypothetical protein